MSLTSKANLSQTGKSSKFRNEEMSETKMHDNKKKGHKKETIEGNGVNNQFDPLDSYSNTGLAGDQTLIHDHKDDAKKDESINNQDASYEVENIDANSKVVTNVLENNDN